MKKAKRGIAGLLSMALMLGCLGSLPASANVDDLKCTSTIDENGVIHTQLVNTRNNRSVVGNYSPTYSDINQKIVFGTFWAIEIPIENDDTQRKIVDYCSDAGHMSYGILSGSSVLNDKCFNVTGFSTKEEAETFAAGILQKKLVSSFNIGNSFEYYTGADQTLLPSGYVYVYADHEITESDLSQMDVDYKVDEHNGNQVALNVGEGAIYENITYDEVWSAYYQLLLSALKNIPGVTGVDYAPSMYLCDQSSPSGVYDPQTYTVHPTGDIDNNETVDTSDIFDVMYYVARKGAGIEDVSFTDGNAVEEAAVFAAADIDGNGKLDSTDVYYMMKYCAEKGAGLNPSWGD